MLRQRNSFCVDNLYQAAFDIGTGVAEAAFAAAFASTSKAPPECSLLSARAGALAERLFPAGADDEARRLAVSLARCAARLRWQRLASSSAAPTASRVLS